jgi:hypothetical protein
MPQLERSRQRVYESLFRFSRPRSLALHVIPQHQLLGVRMQVHLLALPSDPVGHRVAAQMMLEQRQGHDQRQHSLPVVLDEAQKLPTDQRQALSPLVR